MDDYYMKLGAVKAKEIDGELYISCWNFSKALGEKEREISDLCKEIDNLEKQISELESELSVKEDLLKIKNGLCEEEPVKINLNDMIKVKLTPYGVETYYYQFDEINRKAGKTVIEQHMPEIDKDGYTEFQLHQFMKIYGKYMIVGIKEVINPLDIILCD